MQKETFWPLQVCATNRKCSDRRRGIWNLRSNQRMFILVCGINFDISIMVRLAWQSVYSFFFSPLGIYFFGQNPQEYVFLLMIFWGKFYSFKLLLPHSPPPPPSPHPLQSLFAMVQPFKRWLRTNLYLHFRGSDYKHDVAFIKWNWNKIEETWTW